MYVFTSAFFFLFFFGVIKPTQDLDLANNGATSSEVRNHLLSRKIKYENKLKTGKDDSVQVKELLALINEDLKLLQADSTKLDSLSYYKQSNTRFSMKKSKYETWAAYEAAQKALPEKDRDDWLTRQVRAKEIHIANKYRGNSDMFLEAVIEKFTHSFPQILFVSLPLIALLLKLLYIRRRQFYLADHAIYLVHLYCALFILIFLRIVFGYFSNFSYMHWLGFVNTLLVIYCFWYIYKSMRNFYQQGVFNTFAKYVFLLLFSLVVIGMLFGVFAILSVFTV